MAALFPSGSDLPAPVSAPLFPSADLRAVPGASDTLSSSGTDHTWLHNPSFVPTLVSEESVSSDSSCSDYDSIPEPKKIKKRSSNKMEPASVEYPGEKDLYQIDRNPDPENLHYDSVYSGKLAVYRRRFDCLGLRASQKLKWTDGRSRGSRKKRKVENEMRYFTGGSKSTPSEVAIPRKAKTPGIDQRIDYVKLESNLGSLSASDDLTAESYMSQLTGEYNHSLLEQPHNVSLWLEFLAFQDHLLEWGHLPGETTENISRKNRALLERKNSIFERALEHNPTSEDLLVGHMTLVQEMWPTDKMLKKWKDIVFHQPNKPLLWLNYIHFCQTNFSSFGVSSLASVYKKCITTLSSILQGTLKSHLPVPETPSYLLAIFSLFCDFLKQVGCTERAVACYQALIEFNFCVPPGVTEEYRILKEFFEPFWDSGAPRFGEEDALGWSNWTKKNSDENFDSENLGLLPIKRDKSEKKGCINEEGAELELISGLPLTVAWLKLEDYRMTNNWFPWQPDVSEGESEEDCTDPDRIVTFDDVSQTLFRITDPDLKLKLILSFLNFLGVPIDNPPFQSILNIPRNLQTMSEVSLSLSSFIGSCGEEIISYEAIPRGLGLTYSIALSSSHSLLDFAESFSNQALSDTAVGDFPARGPVVCSFISNVCNQALSLLTSPEDQTKIAKVWFLFHFNQLIDDVLSSANSVTKKDVKAKSRSIQKLLKSFLRLEKHRNNLAIWNYYALLEYSVGNFKEAKKLYQSLLSQHSQPDPNLCCTMCECFMGLIKTLCSETETDHDIALQTLVCFSEGDRPHIGTSLSPARVLKARSYFNQIDISSLRDRPQVEMTSVVLCCGYFEYLTRGAKEACEVFKKWEDMLTLSAEEEHGTRKVVLLCCLRIIYTRQLHLLEHHSIVRPVQPSVHRTVIKKALEIFPSDCGFMSSFIKSEQQTFISGRMRRYFDRISPGSKSITPWLFAMISELDRYSRVTGNKCRGDDVEVTSVGTVHRIVSLLSRAAASENARHCPLLWRLYLTVQAYCDPSRVMTIFYQAVHNCPWSKVLYMDAVRLVPTEVDKIMELSEEKEIRLFIPLEEVKLLLQ